MGIFLEGVQQNIPLFYYSFKKKFIYFSFGGVLAPNKQLKTITGPVCIFPVQQSPIDSVVTKILGFRQTDIVLLCIIDIQTNRRIRKTLLKQEGIMFVCYQNWWLAISFIHIYIRAFSLKVPCRTLSTPHPFIFYLNYIDRAKKTKQWVSSYFHSSF